MPRVVGQYRVKGPPKHCAVRRRAQDFVFIYILLRVMQPLVAKARHGLTLRHKLSLYVLWSGSKQSGGAKPPLARQMTVAAIDAMVIAQEIASHMTYPQRAVQVEYFRP
jgi:hypothetical protein